MPVFMTTGTLDFLCDFANKQKFEQPLFFSNQTTTLLYAITNEIDSKHKNNYAKLSPSAKPLLPVESFLHQITKPLFPDEMEKTFHLFQQRVTTLFTYEHVTSFQVLLNEQTKRLIILSQWSKQEYVQQWRNSDQFQVLFNELIESNKHYLHHPYTAIYELKKIDC